MSNLPSFSCARNHSSMVIKSRRHWLAFLLAAGLLNVFVNGQQSATAATLCDRCDTEEIIALRRYYLSLNISTVTFRQFVANLLYNLHRMPALAALYDQLSTVVAEYNDCVLTCSIPFTRRRRLPTNLIGYPELDEMLEKRRQKHGNQQLQRQSELPPEIAPTEQFTDNRQQLSVPKETGDNLIDSSSIRRRAEVLQLAAAAPLPQSGGKGSSRAAALSVMALTLFNSRNLLPMSCAVSGNSRCGTNGQA